MKVNGISNTSFNGKLVIWANSDSINPIINEKELKNFAKETNGKLKPENNGKMHLDCENGFSLDTDNITELSKSYIAYYSSKLGKEIEIELLNMPQDKYNNILTAYNAAYNGEAVINIEI